MIPIETLNHWAESWAAFMGYRLLDSTIVLLVVGSVWFLLRRWLSPQLGYCLFLLVLLKLVVPSPKFVPSLMSDLFPQKAILESFRLAGFERDRFGGRWMLGESAEVQADPSVTISNQNRSSFMEISRKPTLSTLGILMIGWAVIVVLLMLRFAWYQYSTRRKLRKTDPLHLSSAPVDLAQLQQIVGLKRPVRWLTCSWVNSPVVWGVFRPGIVVPSDLFTSFSKNQVRWVLLHELAHIRRGDNVVSMIQGILQVIFFFNPAVWIANILIDQQREYACDDVALASSDAPRTECGEGLLSIAQRANGLPTFMTAPLGLLNHNTLIRRRMMRILDTKRKLHIGLSAGSVAFLLAVALVVLPSVRAEDTRIGENPTLALAETETTGAEPIDDAAADSNENAEASSTHGKSAAGSLQISENLISDNFDDGEARGWEFVDIAGDGRPCKWQVENGELVIEHGSAIIGQPDWENYVVKVRTCTESVSDDWGHGSIIVRRTIINNHCHRYIVFPAPFRRFLWAGLYYLDESNKPRTSTIGEYEHEFSLNTWYTIKVEVNRDKIKVYLDDELVIEGTNEKLRQGNVALGASKAKVHYDDFSVRLIP